jgi:hypothetical protein
MEVLCALCACVHYVTPAKLDPLSDDCHEEVLQLKIWRSKSIESNPTLGAPQACKAAVAAAIAAAAAAWTDASLAAVG